MWNKIKKWLPSRRKIIQLYCAVLFNVNLKGFVSGRIYRGSSKQICAPGINCYSCPGAVGACPLGSLQGSFSADRSTMYYVFGTLFLYGLLFGRMICGWLCPFGLIQELLYKIKTPKLKKSPVTRALSWLKYIILVFFVFIVPITYAIRDIPLPAFCKYICPAGTIEGGLVLLSNKVNDSYFGLLGPIFTWKFLLMVSMVLGCVFVFRLFCRFLCPLGALYGLFNKFSFFGVKLEDSKCVHCNLCVSHCKMDIRKVGDMECISCGECVSVCPTQAISFKGTGVFLKKNDIPDTLEAAQKTKRLRNLTRGLVAAAMAALLIGAGIYFWNQGTETVGSEVGDLCPSYSLDVVAGDENKAYDPTKHNRVTVINFWGTWCTPCVNELPHFDQVARDYEGSVNVVAVHSSLSSETAAKYVAEHYPDSPIVFLADYAMDPDGFISGYYTSLGGVDAWPYTVIIDETGVIQKIFVTPLTHQELVDAVEEVLAS